MVDGNWTRWSFVGALASIQQLLPVTVSHKIYTEYVSIYFVLIFHEKQCILEAKICAQTRAQACESLSDQFETMPKQQLRIQERVNVASG